MAGKLKRIEQTAQALQDELIELGDRFNEAYDQYFHALAPAVQQQLILATYQICTRGYPEHFLDLSVTERSAAQSKVQQLAKQIGTNFEQYFEEMESDESELEVSEPEADRPSEENEPRISREQASQPSGSQISNREEPEERNLDQPTDAVDAVDATEREEPAPEPSRSPDSDQSDKSEQGVDRQATPSSHLANISTWRIEDLTSAKLQQLFRNHHHDHQSASDEADRQPLAARSDSELVEPDDRRDDAGNSDVKHPNSLPFPHKLSEPEAQLIALALQAQLRQAESEEAEEDAATPHSLRAWQRSVERDIVKILHDASVQTNQLLHQCDILPQDCPLGLLETLDQGESMLEFPAGMPNLLKLRLNIGRLDEDEIIGETLHVLAINLRLSEIEFADTAVSQARHGIRQLVAELSGLRKRYEQNQREYAIAKAEAAWRSTWCED